MSMRSSHVRCAVPAFVFAMLSAGSVWAQTQPSPPPADPAPPTAETPPPTTPPVPPVTTEVPAPAPAAPTTTEEPAPPGAPPLPAAEKPEEQKKAGLGGASEFARSPYVIKIGDDPKDHWKISIYGFVEFNAMNDSTRSYGDSAGATVLQRDGTLGGDSGRTQFTARNSRLGFKMESPKYGGIKPSAVFEMDFMGNQVPGISEWAFFNSPAFRIRHAYVKLESSVIDFLAGESYVLFAQQPYFFPASVQYLPIPNMVLHRNLQVRLSRTFKTDPIDVEFAVAAVRPVQRDAQIPDGQAALRFKVNKWKGMHTPGAGGTAADPLAIGVSGLVRTFKVDEFSAAPNAQRTDTGWGLSIDALLPIIPVPNADSRGNALTLNASFVMGSGLADQLGMTAGVTMPTLPNPGGGATAPIYPSNVDAGLVVYDAAGNLHTIDWRAFIVGLQYYLPPSGRIFVSANYTQGESKNMPDLITDPGRASRVYKMSRYFDANVFFDLTAAVRMGLSYQLTFQKFVDEGSARNHRYMLGVYYFF